MHRHRFPGEHGLIEHHGVGFRNACIGRHTIALGQQDHIADHQFARRNPRVCPSRGTHARGLLRSRCA
jgi:hypothetical protein